MKSKKKAKVKSKMKSKVGAGISATEFINKALVTHLLQHAGHLNLTAAEKQSLRDIVEHVGDRDHICTAFWSSSSPLEEHAHMNFFLFLIFYRIVTPLI